MVRKRITLEIFKEELKELVGEEYKVIAKEFINTNTPIEIKHMKCGHIYSVRRNDFKRGRRCPNCSHNKKKDINHVIDRLKNETNGEYILISKEYLKNDKPLIMKHMKCKKEFTTTYARFFNNKRSRCPHCHNLSRRIVMSPEEYRKKVDEIYNGEYIVLEDYKFKTHKLLTRHVVCGHEWKIDPFHLVDERNGCPICNKIAKEESKYIKMIIEILNENKIDFIREFKLFKNPKTGKYLIADFYLEKFNLVIEYDGKQHFKPMFNDIEKLEKQKERDMIKNNLLEENNFEYIRIPYTVNKKADIKNVILRKIETISSEAY